MRQALILFFAVIAQDCRLSPIPTFTSENHNPHRGAFVTPNLKDQESSQRYNTPNSSQSLSQGSFNQQRYKRQQEMSGGFGGTEQDAQHEGELTKRPARLFLRYSGSGGNIAFYTGVYEYQAYPSEHYTDEQDISLAFFGNDRKLYYIDVKFRPETKYRGFPAFGAPAPLMAVRGGLVG